MTIEFDQKGKYYTDFITKDAISARIQTSTHLIEGQIHVQHEHRLKDEMDRDEPFLAITNATVFTNEGQVFFQTQFIAIKRKQIIWVTALDDVRKDDA